eukprot:CAMPEP_0194706532 /NCGR_PEP_ID=MMETSP0295-20121207/29613_1 /TAXON_ID=39354 /ORGANISM="Heterosigma akashiwo, Strain CCMP2393" /LENGTH=45 /DNA_ID= /DNA_START= /DNA_END= /DNA_ORIENTATION=
MAPMSSSDVPACSVPELHTAIIPDLEAVNSMTMLELDECPESTTE